MAEDKQVKKYFENLSYGKDSLASEIHGKVNQEHINKSVASAVRMYDQHMAEGNKEMAEHFKGQIMKWHRDLENLKAIKEEFAMNSGGGRGGDKMYSNYTDLSFDREFFTERGRIMIDEKLDFSTNCPQISTGKNNILDNLDDIPYDVVAKAKSNITEREEITGKRADRR